MTTKTFKRYELKYFVTLEQYERIFQELTHYMSFDKNCKNGASYMIYNLYYDTQDHAVIRHSLEKPYYKEKLRLRSYSMPTSKEETVFLELKKKIGGIVAKRRAIMSYREAEQLVSFREIPKAELTVKKKDYQDNQVIKEILDFTSRYQVTPKVYISYRRVAFFDKENQDFRVSFDQDIITRRDSVNLTNGDYGTELLTSGNYLMEIKCTGGVPLWLCYLLSEMKIYKTSFSKYGTEFQQFLRYQTRKKIA